MKTAETLDKLQALLDSGELHRAFEEARKAVADDELRSDAGFWFTYGKILWRLERRAEAVAAYKTAVALDPESPAKVALELSDDISSFFNPDLLNP